MAVAVESADATEMTETSMQDVAHFGRSQPLEARLLKRQFLKEAEELLEAAQ